MSATDLRAQLNRAREFEHTVGNVTFRCRIPTMQQARRCYAKYDGPERLVAGMQDMLADSVLSIRGATMRDLGLDSDDALPDTQEAAREYLAEHIDAADELVSELSRRSQERQKVIEGDAKN